MTKTTFPNDNISFRPRTLHKSLLPLFILLSTESLKNITEILHVAAFDKYTSEYAELCSSTMRCVQFQLLSLQNKASFRQIFFF